MHRRQHSQLAPTLSCISEAEFLTRALSGLFGRDYWFISNVQIMCREADLNLMASRESKQCRST